MMTTLLIGTQNTDAEYQESLSLASVTDIRYSGAGVVLPYMTIISQFVDQNHLKIHGFVSIHVYRNV